MKVYDSSGTIVVRIAPFDPATDGPCQNELKAPNPVPGTLIAEFHTHPAHVGDEIECSQGHTKIYSDQFGGPSWVDWGGATTSTIQYVMDADNTYRFTGYPVDDSYWEPVLDPITYQPIIKDGAPLKAPKGKRWKNYYQKNSRMSGSCKRY
jgi:hypothetical protein